MEEYNDQYIIDSIRNRDDVAFKYLQVKFQDSIRLMVTEMGGSQEDAKDVFSEGLIALIRLVDRKDFVLNCKLGTLVYALCNKTWKQHLEKQVAVNNYHVLKLESSPEWDFTEEVDQQLYQEIFWESFKRLEKVCQEILEGYLKEISPKDIAEKLGYSYGYVRKRKSMCHGFLMKMIEGHPTYIKIKQSELTLDIE
ncbi:MAG: sigma-70 family RNA polymerase sigma factor [Bacteroidia bacterium]|nr:MAG: sigma-70 family RNA polymerase sigma factor [Bacteroidia bacterium]